MDLCGIRFYINAVRRQRDRQFKLSLRSYVPRWTQDIYRYSVVSRRQGATGPVVQVCSV